MHGYHCNIRTCVNLPLANTRLWLHLSLLICIVSLLLIWHTPQLTGWVRLASIALRSLVSDIPSKHKTHGQKPTEYRFINVVTTYWLIQPVGYCSNHVLPDIRFLNMKFGWTNYHLNVITHLPFKLCVIIRIIV